MKKSAIALVMSVAGLASGMPFAAQAFNAQEVVHILSNHGLVAPQDLERQYGYWSAKGALQDGSRAHVLVSDADGSVLTMRRGDLGSMLPSAAQVIARIQQLGYLQLLDLEFDDGFWEAEVRDGHRKIELVLHPQTLDVLHQSGNGLPLPEGASPNLNSTQIVESLERAGYRHVHDLEFDDDLWEATAINAQGLLVELNVHPGTGAVLREKLDD
ncbi:PepSY domain-containing protein [Diaphorobacter sp.]|uniref:PepSY domain-containing protein n=1 Tax=Diaphorobacter sp. TaxID=1934310 RepID=UPI0028A95C40|nr:PepSY domain-containing protein [Diaphorobacter sp.]